MTTHHLKRLFVGLCLLLLASNVSAGTTDAGDAVVQTIPVGTATSPLALVGDYLIVATAQRPEDGRSTASPALYRVDTTTLEVRREPLDRVVARFERSQGKLFDADMPRAIRLALATFDASIELPVDPNNVAGAKFWRGPWRDVRGEWSRPERPSGGPYLQQIVSYQGRYFRPVEGGHVKLLRPDGATLHRGQLAELPRSWGIFLAPGGPVGFGDGGVYGLDANLGIVSKRIDLGPSGQAGRDSKPVPRRATAIAGDGKTLGLVTGVPGEFDADRNHTSVEVWTTDGRRKLRSEPVRGSGEWVPQDRIVPLGGGYLVATWDLVWVPPGESEAAWRFRAPRPKGQRSWTFSPPVVNNGYVFAVDQDGDLYVFDRSKITGETLPPRRTSPAGPRLIERGVVISTRPRKPVKVGSISTP